MNEIPPQKGELSFFDTLMLVMGGIVGVGIFFTPHGVARAVADPTAFFAMWVIGAGIALCGAFTFAEWAAHMPRAGGWFIFLREAFGPFVAFLFAWVTLGVVSTGAISVIADFGASMLTGFFHDPTAAFRFNVAAIFIVVLTGIIAGGVKVGAIVQNVCMITKLVAIAALVVAGTVFFVPGPGSPGSSEVLTPPSGSIGAGMIAAALPVLFSFGGAQNICYIAPYVRDPEKNVPRAIVIGVVAVGVIYLAINFAFFRVLGMSGIAGSVGFAADVARETLGVQGERAVRAAMAVSAFGVCAVVMIVTPAIYVAMARERLFFGSFGELNTRGAPVLALLTQCVLALVYLTWSNPAAFFEPPLVENEQSASVALTPEILTSSVIFAEWIFHGLAALGLILYSLRPGPSRSHRSWAWPLFPVLYLLAATGVVVGNLWQNEGMVTAIGGVVIVLGAVIYPPWRWWLGRRTEGTR